MFTNIDFKYLIEKNIYLLLIIIFFNIATLTIFNNYPTRPDEIWYLESSMYPTESKKLFFRFYHFYFGKILSIFFNTPLAAAKYSSIILSNLIIFFSYKIVFLNTNSKITSIICALIVSTYPYLLILSSNYSTDITATCIALIYIYITNKIILKKNVNKNYLILGFFLIVGIFSKQSNIILIIPTLLLYFFEKKNFKIALYFFGILVGLTVLSVLNYLFLDNFFYHIDPKNYYDFMNRFSNQLSGDVVKKIIRTSSYTNQIYSQIPWLTYIIVPICFGYLNIKSTLLKRNILIILSLTISSILLFEFFHIPYAGLKLHPRYLIIFNIPLIIVFLLIFDEKLKKIRTNFFNNYLVYLFALTLLFTFLYFLNLNFNIAKMARQFFLLISIFSIPIILGFWMSKELNLKLLVILLIVVILNNFSLAVERFPLINKNSYYFNPIKNLLKNCKKDEINIKIKNTRENQNLIVYLHADNIINLSEFKFLKNLMDNNKDAFLVNNKNFVKKNCNLTNEIPNHNNFKKFRKIYVF